MVIVERVDLTALSSARREKLQLLAEPRFRCCLKGEDPYGISDAVIVAIVAIKEEQPIGLILASVHSEINLSVIHSFQFKWGEWSEDLANQMLQHLETELIKEKGRTATFLYRDEDPYTPVLDAAFETQGWSEPELAVVRYFLDSFTFNPSWFERTPKLPSNYTLFPWSELTEEDRADLLHKLKQGRIPSSVSPFGEDEGIIEPINSVGLKYKNEVIGWVVTHKVAPDTIRYSSIYILPEYQSLGYSITLLVESIKRQKGSKIKWSLFEVRLSHVDARWLKFVDKRLAPEAYYISEVYKTWKSI